MPATKTPHREKKAQGDAEKVRGGAGDWIVKPNGKFYDPKRKAWVINCHGCKKPFYAKRLDARTCSPKCRKRIQRRTLQGASALGF